VAAAKRHARQALGLPLAVVSTVAVAAAPLLAGTVHAHAEPAGSPAAGGPALEGQLLSLGAPAARALGFPAGAELRLGDHLRRWPGAARSIGGAGDAVHPRADSEAGAFSPGVYRMSTAVGPNVFHPYYQSGFTIHVTPGNYQPGGGGFPYGGACHVRPESTSFPQSFQDTVTSYQRVDTSHGSYEIHTVTYIMVTPRAECGYQHGVAPPAGSPPGGAPWYGSPPAGSPPGGAPSAGAPPQVGPGPSGSWVPGPGNESPLPTPPGSQPATPDPPYRPGAPTSPPLIPIIPPPTLSPGAVESPGATSAPEAPPTSPEPPPATFSPAAPPPAATDPSMLAPTPTGAPVPTLS
jgi:hypothetical protein